MIVHHNAFTPPSPFVVIFGIVALVIYVRVLMYFIDDLYKPERRVYGGDKTVWLVIMVVGSIAGILAYLLFGRER